MSCLQFFVFAALFYVLSCGIIGFILSFKDDHEPLHDSDYEYDQD